MPAPAVSFFFFQAEDGIRDLVRSRGLGDVYKRQDRLRCCVMLAPVGCFDRFSVLVEISLARRAERHVLSLIHI